MTDRRTDGRTDGRTDRILIARPRLHFMQRGKNRFASFSASVSLCIRLWDCGHSHGRISRSTFTKIGTDVRTAKSNKMLGYRRETALQGVLVLAKWKTGTGRQYFTDIIGLSSTTVCHNRPAKLSNSVKKCKIRAITAIKVIQGHRDQYQSKARVHILSRTVFELSQLIVQILDTLRFLSPPLGGVGTTYMFMLGSLKSA